MFTKFTLTLVTLVLLVTLAGCGAKSTPTPGTDNSQTNGSETQTGTNPTENKQLLPLISGKPANIVLDSSADGSTQQVKQGDIIAVTLESNLTTGYSWFATISDPKVLVQMGEPQYQEPASSTGTPLMGAAGKQTFFLQATGTGTASVTLEYKRSFEENVTPEKTITITLEVK
jgi:predicted secreted protein/predicted small lipoprotein YifL